ncbi:MAG: hypothetical protein LBP55_01370 [Candidatus Adiutrix sp.]|nr:hypothetical protein [Candidatus Adiutrix sp.]
MPVKSGKHPLLMMTLALAGLALAGCGVVIDMAEDNEWRWGSFGTPSFISPVKLKVGVAPFSDEVGLGASETGSNLAALLAEELSRDSRLIIVPAAEIQAAMGARGYSLPLNQQQAAEIGSDLRLNALIVGSLSEVKKYNQRKGWRRLARIFTTQREYVDAVLAVSAVDAHTGIILVSRANVGQFDGGTGGKDFSEAGDRSAQLPEQEALEGSLDEALKESYYRTMSGLAALPFKARVLTAFGGEATIGFGSEVGLQPGQEFARLEVERLITSTIGETYQVMGAPVARLKVTSVDESRATLEIEEGHLAVGDVIQTID